MKNEVAKVEQQSNELTDIVLVEYLDVMGISPKLDAKEKLQFLNIAKTFGLNPFKREIFCTVYGEGQYKQMSIITGYEVYIKRAERSGQLDGWHAETSGSVATNDLKAKVTIHRKDRSHPFIWEVFYEECVQKTKAGVVTKFWEKSNFMTKKVAISQAFRLCFSDELGGMPYTSDEMPQQEIIEITHKVVQPVIIVEPISDEQALFLIDTATTLEELKQAWESLSGAEKKITTVMAKKEAKKLELQNVG